MMPEATERAGNGPADVHILTLVTLNAQWKGRQEPLQGRRTTGSVPSRLAKAWADWLELTITGHLTSQLRKSPTCLGLRESGLLQSCILWPRK